MSDPHPAPWNLADVWEAVADTVPDAPALIHADRTVSWSAFDDRAARLAAVFDAAGLRPGSKVAHYLYNGPEYIEATFAAFKCRAVPVNVNYRYTEHELRYLFANSDAEAIVVDDDLAPHVDALLPELTKVRLVVRVGPNGDYEQRLPPRRPPRLRRSMGSAVSQRLAATDRSGCCPLRRSCTARPPSRAGGSCRRPARS